MNFERIVNISASCCSLIAFLFLIVDKYNSLDFSSVNIVKFTFFAILIIAMTSLVVYVLRFIYICLKDKESLVRICLSAFFFILILIISMFVTLLLLSIIDILIEGIFHIGKDFINSL